MCLRRVWIELPFESSEIVDCMSKHCKSTWRFFSAFCVIFPSVSLVKRQVVLIFLMFYIINGSVMPNLQICFTIPIILIQLGIMGMGIGIIVSSLTTKYRDLSVLVTFGIQLWMYITPVVYPLSQAGIGKLRYILLINPVTTPIELFRCGILGKGEVEITYLIWSWIFTIIVAVAGIMIFNKVERTFMDTV